MGYNGNNRKLRSSVIKKSSLNFGTKITSKLLAWPIAMTASATIDSIENIKTNEKYKSLSNNDHNSYINEIIPIATLADNEYDYIKQNYRENIIANNQTEAMITDIKNEIKKSRNLLSLIGFIPPIKRKISKKISILEEKIKVLTLSKKTIEIDIESITLQKEYNPIFLSGKTNVYLTFNPIYDYYSTENMYTIERRRISFFPFNIPSLLSLNFKTFQIGFYNSVLIITTQNDFAIISYSHIKTNIQNVHIIEKQLVGNIKYENVKETWLHTCLNGTPDLRYRDNPKVYNVEYWNLSINIRNSFNVNILFTDKKIVQDLYNLITCINS